MSKFYQLEPDEWLKICNELKPAELKVFLYIKTLGNPSANSIKGSDIARSLKIDRATVSRAIQGLVKLNYLPSEFATREIKNPEQQVRDRLHIELGGQSEVVTAVGRIDLLTDTQIIEVKEFCQWKSAMGQVLAYSAFFPEHQKRIHLFGSSKDLKKLGAVISVCSSFDILVTDEVLP